MGAESLQSCLTLCDPMNCSLPGSCVHGILHMYSKLPSPLKWKAYWKLFPLIIGDGDVLLHFYSGNLSFYFQGLSNCLLGLLISVLLSFGLLWYFLLFTDQRFRSTADLCLPYCLTLVFGNEKKLGTPDVLSSLLPVYQFSSVTQLCPTLCDPMNRSTPGLPVHHQLQEFTHTHVHWVADAIQPSHLLSSPSPPAPNPSQHLGLLQWVSLCMRWP